MFDYKKFHGEVLDAYDGLPGDLKGDLQDTPLGKLLEGRLQQTDIPSDDGCEYFDDKGIRDEDCYGNPSRTRT